MAFPAQLIPRSPEELERVMDDDPPLAQVKQQVLQQDITVHHSMRQLHVAYCFISAEFHRISVDSLVLVLVDDPMRSTLTMSFR